MVHFITASIKLSVLYSIRFQPLRGESRCYVHVFSAIFRYLTSALFCFTHRVNSLGHVCHQFQGVCNCHSNNNLNREITFLCLIPLNLFEERHILKTDHAFGLIDTLRVQSSIANEMY